AVWDEATWFKYVGSWGFDEKAWEKFKLKNVKLNTADAFNWQVMGLGLRSAGNALVFSPSDFRTELFDPSYLDTVCDWWLYGVDFGYKINPSAIVKTWKVGHRLYIKQVFNELGYLNNELAEWIINNGHGDGQFICDPAPPQGVDDLTVNGINAFPAEKGSGSVFWGLQSLKQFELVFYENDNEIVDQIESYQWKVDKNGNFVLNSLGQRVPSPSTDHDLIDATRYGGTYFLDRNIDVE
ncbi:MAG: hypothetical protein AAF740_14520, partial [Bacteroidota bacterium]